MLITWFIVAPQNWSLMQAIAYHARIERCCEFLSEHPFAARLRNEVRPPVRAYPCQSHVIVYEIDDANNILIVRVCYGREDWLDL